MENILRQTQAPQMQQATASGPNPFAQAQKPPVVADDNVTMRSIRQRELSQREALNNLQLVLDNLNQNPETLERAHTLTGKMQTGALAFRDKLGVDALDISPEQEQQVGDVAAYKQRLMTNVNNYIKEITGATVGQGDETTRLMAVQPNADDSPSQLIAKLQGAADMARLNIARYRYMQSANMEEAPTDAELRQVLMQRGQQFLQQAQTQGLEGNEARMWAAQQLQKEFGF